MGVNGLWKLLESVARPSTLESLRGQILAIDVSIWLHQAVKGSRDDENDDAFLITLFTRICKLLYYGIKPIFVFDGDAPYLKYDTLNERQQRRNCAGLKLNHNVKSLIDTKLRQHALSTVFGDEKIINNIQDQPSTSKSIKPDLFELPKNEFIPEKYETSSDDENGEDLMCWPQFQNVSDIKIESDEFQCLPAKIKHEFLINLKKHQTYTHNTQNIDIKCGDDFSNYQMQRLRKKHIISKEIKKVEKDLIEIEEEKNEISWGFEDYEKTQNIVKRRVIGEKDTNYVYVADVSQLKRKSDNKTEKKVDQSKLGGGFILDESSDDQSVNEDVQGHSISSQGYEIEANVEPLNVSENVKKSVISIDKDTFMESSAIGGAGFIVDSKDSQEINKSIELDDLSEDMSDVSSIDIPTKVSRHDITIENVKSCINNKDSVIIIDQISDNKNTIDKDDHQLKKVITDSEVLVTGPSDIILKRNDTSNRNSLIDEEHSKEYTENLSKNNHEFTPSNESIIPECKHDGLSRNNIIKETDKEDNDHCEQLLESSFDSESDEQDNTKFHEFTESVKILNRETIDRKLNDEKNRIIHDIETTERSLKTITQLHYEKAKELLELFHVPYIQAPCEAEAQCAYLEQHGICSGSITDDSDIWLFGGMTTYKNFFSKSKDLQLYRYDDMTNELLLDREACISIALLCGSDYTSGVDRVGPVTAREILGEFMTDEVDALHSLQIFKEWYKTKVEKNESKIKLSLRKNKYILNEGFPSKRVIMAYQNPSIKECETIKFDWSKKPDLEDIRGYSEITFNWSKKKCDEIVMPMIKKLNDKQKIISSYFINEKLPVKTSKRIKNAILRQKKSAKPIIKEKVKKKKANKKESKEGGFTRKVVRLSESSNSDSL